MLESGVLALPAADADWVPDWIPKGGVQQGLPFVVILIVMVALGRGLPTRSAVLQRRFPASPPVRHPWRGIAGARRGRQPSALLTLSSDWRLGLIVSMVAAVVALSFVVLTGFVGQISVAQMAIAGIAGFMAAKLTVEHGVPFPLAPLLAMAAAGLIGVLAGLPAMRVRGMSLAVATLAFSVAVEELVFKSSAFTKGIGGIDVPEPRAPRLGVSASPGRGSAYPRAAVRVSSCSSRSSSSAWW